MLSNTPAEQSFENTLLYQEIKRLHVLHLSLKEKHENVEPKPAYYQLTYPLISKFLAYTDGLYQAVFSIISFFDHRTVPSGAWFKTQLTALGTYYRVDKIAKLGTEDELNKLVDTFFKDDASKKDAAISYISTLQENILLILTEEMSFSDLLNKINEIFKSDAAQSLYQLIISQLDDKERSVFTNTITEIVYRYIVEITDSLFQLSTKKEELAPFLHPDAFTKFKFMRALIKNLQKSAVIFLGIVKVLNDNISKNHRGTHPQVPDFQNEISEIETLFYDFNASANNVNIANFNLIEEKLNALKININVKIKAHLDAYQAIKLQLLLNRQLDFKEKALQIEAASFHYGTIEKLSVTLKELETKFSLKGLGDIWITIQAAPHIQCLTTKLSEKKLDSTEPLFTKEALDEKISALKKIKESTSKEVESKLDLPFKHRQSNDFSTSSEEKSQKNNLNEVDLALKEFYLFLNMFEQQNEVLLEARIQAQTEELNSLAAEILELTNETSPKTTRLAEITKKLGDAGDEKSISEERLKKASDLITSIMNRLNEYPEDIPFSTLLPLFDNDLFRLFSFLNEKPIESLLWEKYYQERSSSFSRKPDEKTILLERARFLSLVTKKTAIQGLLTEKFSLGKSINDLNLMLDDKKKRQEELEKSKAKNIELLAELKRSRKAAQDEKDRPFLLQIETVITPQILIFQQDLVLKIRKKIPTNCLQEYPEDTKEFLKKFITDAASNENIKKLISKNTKLSIITQQCSLLNDLEQSINNATATPEERVQKFYIDLFNKENIFMKNPDEASKYFVKSVLILGAGVASAACINGIIALVPALAVYGTFIATIIVINYTHQRFFAEAPVNKGNEFLNAVKPPIARLV